MMKVTLKIIGMHCTSCAINIDGELEDTEGIVESSTSYAKQRTVVEFDESKMASEKIISIIHKLDNRYSAEIDEKI